MSMYSLEHKFLTVSITPASPLTLIFPKLYLKFHAPACIDKCDLHDNC